MAQGTPALTLLKQKNIHHIVHEYHHDPSVTSFGLEAAAALGRDPQQVFKTLLADVDGTPTVGIVPVDVQLDLKALAMACGKKKASMLDPQVAARITGYVVGGISPLGQKKLLTTVIDESALLFDTILVSAGKRGLDVELSPNDLLQLLNAQFAQIATAR